MSEIRKTKGVCRALLTAVGDYTAFTESNLPVLPVWEQDLRLMEQGLRDGLHFEKDHISRAGADGYVSAHTVAQKLKDLAEVTGPEDTFVFYFSGHGSAEALIFSDEKIRMQSVFDYIERMPAGNKIVILDCCHSGRVRAGAAPEPDLTQGIDAFAGRGSAILASSAADAVSRLNEEQTASLYTAVLSSAMCSPHVIRHGKISLQRIADLVFAQMDFHNQLYPDRRQHPVYRSSMGGTVYFDTGAVSRRAEQFWIRTDSCMICSVKDISTKKQRRQALFLLPVSLLSREQDGNPLCLRELCDPVKLAAWTREAAQAAGDGSTEVVFCYFGQDYEDLIRHVYFACTSYTEDPKLQKIYYRPGQHVCVADEVHIRENTSYDLLRRMREDVPDEADFIQSTRELLSAVVSFGEVFIRSIQALANGETDIREIRRTYQSRIRQVRMQYFCLADGALPPPRLQGWCDEVMNLAGCILDLSILLEQEQELNAESYEKHGKSREWQMRFAVNRYYESMERLKVIEGELHL